MYNKLIEDCQVLYKDQLGKLQQLDVERVQTIQNCLRVFFTAFNDSGGILKEKMEECEASVQLLSPETDTRLFVEENKTTKVFSKIEFIPYDYSQKLVSRKKESEDLSEDLIDFGRKHSTDSSQTKPSGRRSTLGTDDGKNEDTNYDLLFGTVSVDELKEDTDVFNENKDFVYNAIDGLFNGTDLSNEDQLKVFELLHESYVSSIVAKYLHSFKSPRKLASMSVMKSLSEIIKYLITVSIHDKQNDFEIIHAVLG